MRKHETTENKLAKYTTTPKPYHERRTIINNNDVDSRNKTTKSRQSGKNNTSLRNCYTCHNACVYKTVQLLFIVSIGASVLVIIRVCQYKRLHKPTFVAIACLAVSDAIFLTLNYARALEIIIRSLTCTTAGSRILYSPVLEVIVGIAWFSSNGHITLLAIVRYKLLVDPIRSMYYLTNKRVMLSSLFIWVLGAFIFGIFAISTSFYKPKNIINSSILWIIVYLMPLVTTIVLHFAKLINLRRSLANRVTSKISRDIVIGMTRMIFLLVFLAVICPLPRFVYLVLERIKQSSEVTREKQTFRNIAHLCFLTTYAVNPFVYAFMSPLFRKSFRKNKQPQTPANETDSTNNIESMSSSTNM